MNSLNELIGQIELHNMEGISAFSPQMRRDETIVSATVIRLLKHAYDIDYTPANVPCKDLQ